MASQNLFSSFQTPYDRNDRAGIGVHLLTGLRTAEIAFGNTFQIVEEERSPAQLKANHAVCESQSDFTQTQELNLKGEGSKDSLKIGGGLDIMIKRTVNAKTVVCTSNASCFTGTDKYDPNSARLTDEARATLKRSPEEFVRRFGTHFVGGYNRGATFTSVISFETKTSNDKLHVGARLRGSYNGKVEGKGKSGSGSGKYGFDSDTEKRLKQVRGELYATGVTSGAHVSDLDAIAAEFAAFSERAMQASTPVAAICFPYTMIEEVASLLSAHGRAGALYQPIRYSLVDAVCREARETLRAISMIESTDLIANGIESCRKLNKVYRGKLQESMDHYRQLSLDDLAHPPEVLMKMIGLPVESAPEEVSSHSAELYREWQKKFDAAYQDII
jgi:hypothetical protein